MGTLCKGNANLKHPGWLKHHGIPDLTLFSGDKIFPYHITGHVLLGKGREDLGQRCNIFCMKMKYLHRDHSKTGKGSSERSFAVKASLRIVEKSF